MLGRPILEEHSETDSKGVFDNGRGDLSGVEARIRRTEVMLKGDTETVPVSIVEP